MPKLTDRFLASFKPAEGQKDRLTFDTECRGLGVRAYWATQKKPDGSKVTVVARTFLLQWTDPATGQKRREPLGVWGGITIDQAREAARIRLGDVAKGIDPRAERKAKREAAEREREAAKLTLRVLLDQWSRLGLKDRRPSYRAEAVRALSHAFAKHLDKPAHHLSRDTAVNVLDRLAEAGRSAMAGRTLAYGRACYGWAQKRGKVPLNPFLGLPVPAGIIARDRVLTAQEVGEVWRAAGTLGFPFGPLVRLLLLTAQRREEVGGMRWSELSADLAVWTIPASRAKNGTAHVVHLAPEARTILADLPRFEGCDFVFTTTGKTPASGYSKAVERVRAVIARARAKTAQEAGVEPEAMPGWRLHDLRRSAVTWLAGAGFPPHVCDKLLNHVTTTGLSDVARVYQRAEFLPERKAALEAWARHVLQCASDDAAPAAGNVVALPMARYS
ncbi:MAG: site-specific integrase [Acetobacteraceae bacterium]|nr:site-specific integrase [Acetobacteraceae bacterium]